MLRTLLRLFYKSLRLSLYYVREWWGNLLFRFLLWIQNVNYGKNVSCLHGSPVLEICKDSIGVTIGNNVRFNNHKAGTGWFSKCALVVKPNALLEIGDNCGFNGTLICVADSVKIGNYVQIGGGTRIYDTNFHNLDYEKRRHIRTNTIAKTAPVVIEDDVFIGTNCIISKGVTIGCRSIIAAGSVVVKNIPPDCIAGGNPCKILKYIN